MRTSRNRKTANCQGNLLVVLVMCTALIVGIAGYFAVIQQQTMLSKRSQTWNIAMAIVEAGIEEGLEHLNCNYTNLLADGWTKVGNVYTRSQTLSDGNSYSVTIEEADTINPSIVSKAFINAPVLVQNRVQTGFFASIGQTTASQTVARAVRVRTARGHVASAAAVAKQNIYLNGNGVLSDSFDSGNSAKSTNGRYDPAKYSGDMGDMATNGGILNSVGVGNANIYGRLHTGPDCPVTLGPNGGVGTHTWQSANTGIQPGYLLQNANFTYPDTRLPSTAGLLPPASGTVIVAQYSVSSNATTSLVYPWGWVGPIATNTTWVTVASMPSPTPAGLVTNASFVETTTLPIPVPAGTITNYQTLFTSSMQYPAPGTYLGGVGTNVTKKLYSYQKITGRIYSYYRYTYSYPTFTYSYNGVTVTRTTNYYDSIIYANTTNAASSLPGKTLIAGPNACLVLPNGLTGAEDITIAQGANVLVHAGGPSLTISGNQFLNPNAFAGSFIVYCAPSVTTFTLNGNGQFTGVLVAPEADLKLNGGGASVEDFCGAMMVKNIILNGHFKFHYDEALRRMPSTGRYLITSWDEIAAY